MSDDHSSTPRSALAEISPGQPSSCRAGGGARLASAACTPDFTTRYSDGGTAVAGYSPFGCCSPPSPFAGGTQIQFGGTQSEDDETEAAATQLLGGTQHEPLETRWRGSRRKSQSWPIYVRDEWLFESVAACEPLPCAGFELCDARAV
ncbi:hypothetical protein EMIHUDRAFT_244367 [Emiliania huxleyi CCMP1516]|uniref:BRCT domain-containing protein n=2 Tax=Emiliania huxleyi TaxID=2903 RepID=A0A0D3J0X8_EMIH1|nr:hypothetical protein EMIHUDRAFT_244367 [Emiliania huxleyi CCMP1516]EOD17163.1 hypothetical protein EMIHUDRAFT_244367 [Emiliania huxleyi CCMP1516]|eukprot:XP_005769592.1 hypothetical protein EMIHUDRAFT_244367 [Emiliania huxleyi CCMP1516]